MKLKTVLISIPVLAAAMLLSASVAVAAKPEKATILHCGCNMTGDAMVYSEISISRNSAGHVNHVAGTIDSCFDGVDTYTDITRTGSDCQVAGPALRNPIPACPEVGGPAAGDICGSADPVAQ